MKMMYSLSAGMPPITSGADGFSSSRRISSFRLCSAALSRPSICAAARASARAAVCSWRASASAAHSAASRSRSRSTRSRASRSSSCASSRRSTAAASCPRSHSSSRLKSSAGGPSAGLVIRISSTIAPKPQLTTSRKDRLLSLPRRRRLTASPPPAPGTARRCAWRSASTARPRSGRPRAAAGSRGAPGCARPPSPPRRNPAAAPR